MASFSTIHPSCCTAETSPWAPRERTLPFHLARVFYDSEGNLADSHRRAVCSLSYTVHGSVTVPENLIYHYTSIEAFSSMMATGELWASHHSSMNDFQEIEHAWRVVCQQTANYMLKKGFCGNKFSAVEAVFLENLEFYICSFSREENSLAQWRAYAHPSGVAVSFSESLFPSFGCSFSPYVLKPVIYDDVAKANAVLSIAKKLAEVFDSGMDISDIRLMAYSLKDQFRHVAPFLKNGGFSEENEIRLVSDGKGYQIFERDGRFGKVKFIKISFLEAFQFADGLDFCVCDVLTGPSRDPNKCVSRVGEIMNKNRRKFKVIYDCGIPFR